MIETRPAPDDASISRPTHTPHKSVVAVAPTHSLAHKIFYARASFCLGTIGVAAFEVEHRSKTRTKVAHAFYEPSDLARGGEKGRGCRAGGGLGVSRATGVFGCPPASAACLAPTAQPLPPPPLKLARGAALSSSDLI
jgi:hypothetical protein